MKAPKIFVVLTAIWLVVSLIGCGDQTSPPSKSATPAPPSAPAAPAAPPPPASSASPAPPAAAIASAESELPGLRVEIQELKRTPGGTLTLKLAFVNNGQQDVSMGQFGTTGFNQWSLAGITLVDIVGKKKYFAASDSEGKCLCSMDIPKLKPQARVNLWAKFPAPPADVQKIGILIPHFAPLEEVPLS